MYRVREVIRANFCGSVPGIDLAVSVDILQVIQCRANSYLRVIDGFDHSLIGSIEISVSVEIITGFEDSSISDIIFEEGTTNETIEIGDMPRQLSPLRRGTFIIHGDTNGTKYQGQLNVISGSI
jgi:hypothetical protein